MRPSPWEDRWIWAALAALVVVGFLLRLHHYLQPFLGDEISTLYIVKGNGLGGTVSAIASDQEISPPLYFILAWFSSKLGSSPDLLRLPSLIAGTLSIPLVYLLGARAVSRRAGLIAAAVMTLNPFMIFYSADGRTYAVAIALLLGSTLAMLAAARTGRTRWWVAYSVLTVLAMYTHYTAAFILGAQLLWLLWAHPQCRLPALLANVGAAILFVPWIPSTLADFSSPTVDILSALQGDGFDVKRQAVEVWAFGYPYLTPGQVPGQFALVLTITAVAVAAIAALVRWSGLVRDRIRARFPAPSKGVVLVLVLALATPVIELLILGLTGNDLFGARNLNTSSAGLALAIGAILSLAGPVIGTICTVAVLAGFSIGAARTLRPESGPIRFDEAASFIRSEAEPGDVVVDALSAAVTPVPLTPLAVYLDEPPLQEPLNFPTGPPPFLPFKSPRPPENEVYHRALREAADGHIFLVGSSLDVTNAAPGERAGVDSSSATQTTVTLPPGAEVLEQRSYEGVAPLSVYEVQLDPTADGRAG